MLLILKGSKQGISDIYGTDKLLAQKWDVFMLSDIGQ